ncbi:MAG: MBL fold metallo-hydrolase [Thermomicrobiales bacterium]
MRAGRSNEQLRGYIAHTREMIEQSRRMREIDADGFNMLHPEQILRPFPADFDADSYAVAPSEATETLADGQVIDLGGRRLEVIHTPGHSPDGICLLARDERILFTADTVYAGPLYAQTLGANLDDYLASLRRLEPLIDEVDMLLPSHNRAARSADHQGDDRGFERRIAGQAPIDERTG